MVSEEREPSLRAELVIVVLALVSVGLLLVELVMELAPADRLFLDRVDLIIAVIFLSEWSWRFHRAERKGRFFAKYWWELLASIPLTTEVTQALRGLRVLRLIRVIRLLRLVRLATRLSIIARHSRRFAGQTHMISLSTTVGTILLGSTLAFHYFEAGENPNVDSLFDSFWWAMCTVTTVGYGDIYPVTIEGRFIGILLMLLGVGVVASYTALIASYFVQSSKDDAAGESE